MKKFLLAAFAAMLTATVAIASGTFSSSKTTEFVATVETSNNTATNIFEVSTISGGAYLIDVKLIAREVAGANKDKGKAHECFLGAANAAGTLTVSSAVCQTASGNLTEGGIAFDADGTLIRAKVTGAAAPEVIDWIARVIVVPNEEHAGTTTSTSTSSTTTTSTSTSSTTTTSTT